MYELTRLTYAMLQTLLVYSFTTMSFTPLLPHLTSHSGKTHFDIKGYDTLHYTFRFTSLGYDGVKPNRPSSLSGRYFRKIVHENYLYPGQSDEPQILWQRVLEGILRFTQVASEKGSKRGSNAVWMSVWGFTPRGVKLLGNIMIRKELGLEKEGKSNENVVQMREERMCRWVKVTAFGRRRLCKRLSVLLYSQILCSLPTSALPPPAFTCLRQPFIPSSFHSSTEYMSPTLIR
jgi:hypothetical protein